MKLTYGYARVSTKHQDLNRQIENIREKYPKAKIFADKYTGKEIDRPKFSIMLQLLRPGDTVVFDAVDRMSRNAEEGFKLYRELFEKGVNLIFLKDPGMDTDLYRQALKKHIDLQIDTGHKALDKYMEKHIEALNELLLDLAQAQFRLAFESAQKEVEMKTKNINDGIEKRRTRNEELEREFPETYMQHPDYKKSGRRAGVKLTTKKSVAAKEVIRKYNRDFGGPLNDVQTMIQAGLLPADYDKQTKKDGSRKTIKDYNRSTYYKYKRELMAELKESGE